MMKITLLQVLLAALSAIAVFGQRNLTATIPEPSHCFSVYPRKGLKGTIGGHKFTGVKYSVDLIHINDPFYATYKDAVAGGNNPIGRVLGFFSEVTQSGPVGLEFFKTESWLALYNGQGPNGIPNVILGGSGCFLGATGTITRTTLANGKVFQYLLCTKDALPCSP